MKRDLNAATLRELLDYDPETGVFRRRVRSSNRINVGDVAGSANGDGYLKIRILGRHYRAHRLAWLYAYGEWPVGQIDHINGRRDDNRIENLRDVNHCENTRNAKIKSNNKTGVLGVYWYKRNNKFYAQIRGEGRQIFIGSFDTLDAAAFARKEAERKYGYHSNHGRSRQ